MNGPIFMMPRTHIEEIPPSRGCAKKSARPTGYSFDLATQAPSFLTVYGLIKANFKARISFSESLVRFAQTFWTLWVVRNSWAMAIYFSATGNRTHNQGAFSSLSPTKSVLRVMKFIKQQAANHTTGSARAERKSKRAAGSR